MKTKPLDDLEIFELLRLCYPDKFLVDDDATFDAAIEFAEQFSGFNELADLLGRVIMLTMPMSSAITGKQSHCLGKLTMICNSVHMMAVVRRDVE